MPASILRWRGGAGGDMLLYLKSLSCPGSVVNVDFLDIDKSGKTNVDFSKIKKSNNLREMTKLALDKNWVAQIKLEELSVEIKEYASKPACVWIKSHYYDTNQFDNITVDLVADPLSLPFVILANISKASTLEQNFNRLVGSITDPMLKKKYSLYSVAVDNVMNFCPSGAQHLFVSDLLSGVNTLKTATDRVNLQLDFQFSHVYEHWFKNNRPYLPSKQYQKMVQRYNYDFMNTRLSLSERYSLMALSGNKFINLS